MNKYEMAEALREAAKRIEASDYEGRKLSAEISVHLVTEINEMTSLVRIADKESIRQDNADNVFWMNSLINACKFVVFFSPELFGDVVTEVEVVTKKTKGKVLDLLDVQS